MNDKILLVLIVLGYNIAVGFSIITLGLATDKGGLDSIQNFLKIILNWYFMVGLALALVSRMLFVTMNSILNRIAETEAAATSITYLLSLTSTILVLLLNWLILKETLSTRQIFGALLVSCGVILLF